MLGSGRHKIETEDIRGITVLSSIWWENVKYLMEKTCFGNLQFSIFPSNPQIVKQTSYIPMGLMGQFMKKNQELVNCEVMNSYGFYGDWTRIFMGEIVSRSSSETPWRPGKLSLGQLLMPQVCHDDISTNCVAKNIFEKFMTFKIYGEIDVYQFIPFTLSSHNHGFFVENQP